MRIGKIHIEGDNCVAIILEYIKNSSPQIYLKEMDSNYLIWAESFSWWTLDSVMFCFVISNIDSNTCEIEIISGSEKKGFFKVKTDQGYFATLKFYNKIRNLAKENNWIFKDTMIKDVK